ncbi:universal stress protein [Haloterrigena salinisoli]|uniref:universal stress protein n=1 Tax=Haloterrigena salinisoli TaxID=3132747 RepID=UPI0031F2F326
MLTSLRDRSPPAVADMIVMGTAGPTGLEKRIVGSATDTVVRTASLPVVTVRPEGTIDAA